MNDPRIHRVSHRDPDSGLIYEHTLMTENDVVGVAGPVRVIDPKAQKQAPSTSCCGPAPVVKGLCIRHYGVPWYHRLWLRRGRCWREFIRPFEGCGCPVKTRAALDALLQSIQMVRAA